MAPYDGLFTCRTALHLNAGKSFCLQIGDDVNMWFEESGLPMGSNGEPEIPPAVPPEAPPAEVPPEIAPEGPEEEPGEAPAEMPSEQPVEIPPQSPPEMRSAI
jgi:hypothetical protein